VRPRASRYRERCTVVHDSTYRRQRAYT
jgi:hypothetical protein